MQTHVKYSLGEENTNGALIKNLWNAYDIASERTATQKIESEPGKPPFPYLKENIWSCDMKQRGMGWGNDLETQIGILLSNRVVLLVFF